MDKILYSESVKIQNKENINFLKMVVYLIESS
jgi:hypothetical protein